MEIPEPPMSEANIKSVCMGCGLLLKGLSDAYWVSHGYCKECGRREMEKFKNDLGRRNPDESFIYLLVQSFYKQPQRFFAFSSESDAYDALTSLRQRGDDASKFSIVQLTVDAFRRNPKKRLGWGRKLVIADAWQQMCDTYKVDRRLTSENMEAMDTLLCEIENRGWGRAKQAMSPTCWVGKIPSFEQVDLRRNPDDSRGDEALRNQMRRVSETPSDLGAVKRLAIMLERAKEGASPTSPRRGDEVWLLTQRDSFGGMLSASVFASEEAAYNKASLLIMNLVESINSREYESRGETVVSTRGWGFHYNNNLLYHYQKKSYKDLLDSWNNFVRDITHCSYSILFNIQKLTVE